MGLVKDPHLKALPELTLGNVGPFRNASGGLSRLVALGDITVYDHKIIGLTPRGADGKMRALSLCFVALHYNKEARCPT